MLLLWGTHRHVMCCFSRSMHFAWAWDWFRAVTAHDCLIEVSSVTEHCTQRHGTCWCMCPQSRYLLVHVSPFTVPVGACVPSHGTCWCMCPHSRYLLVHVSPFTVPVGACVPSHGTCWCMCPHSRYLLVHVY